MEIALISPPTMMLYANLNPKYSLMLPTLLPEPKYWNHYRSNRGYKILDNGAAEQYIGSMEHHSLIDWGESVGADEIVVPDVLGDLEETLSLARLFMQQANEAYQFTYAGVVQGQNPEEWARCVEHYAKLGYIKTLMLPRVMARVTGDKAARVDFATELHMAGLIGEGKTFEAIHCLGSHEWVREVVALNDLGFIRGMDTSLPVYLGLMGIRISELQFKPRPQDFFHRRITSNQIERIMYDNCITYLLWGGSTCETPSPSAMRELRLEHRLFEDVS